MFLDKTDPWFGVYGTTKNKTLFCFLPSFHPMVGQGRGVYWVTVGGIWHIWLSERGFFAQKTAF